MVHFHRWLFLVSTIPLVTACTVTHTTSSATSDGGAPTTGGPTTTDGGDAGTAPSATPAPLTCLDVLKCIGACPASDHACPDACNAKGSPDAQADVIAIATCIDKNACQDATCAKA